MPKFCDNCKKILIEYTSEGVLKFRCICGKTFDAEPNDTLLYEVYPEAASSNQKYITYIKNSPHDLAGNKVLKDCEKCGLNYMTRIYVGGSNIMHTCIVWEFRGKS